MDINLNGIEKTSNKKTDVEGNKTSDVFYPSVRAVYDWAVAKFQDGLVSGTNIKTINGSSLLGSGDLVVGGGLDYFAESEHTTGVNATVNVSSFEAVLTSTNGDVSFVPKGNGAFLASIPDGLAAGGNKRGIHAVDLQTKRSSNGQVGSGAYSIIPGGLNNKATSTASFSSGQGCESTKPYAFSHGIDVKNDGISSGGIGESITITADNVMAFGRLLTISKPQAGAWGFVGVIDAERGYGVGSYFHTFSLYGRQVYSAGKMSTTGDSQTSNILMRGRTSDDTPLILTTNISPSSPTNQVILQDNQAITFIGTISGKQNSSGNAAGWKVEGLLSRQSGAATTVLSGVNVTAIDNAPGWVTPTLTVDTVNGGMNVTIEGLPATNIQWQSVIKTNEIIY